MPTPSPAGLAALALSLAAASAGARAAAQAGDEVAQAGPPAAQQEPGAEGGATREPIVTEDTIVVFGARLLGQVDAPQPPLLELGAEEVSAYGAGSIAELLQQLTPQISSARGRGGGGGPVILVNGVRVSSFRELRSYPPEAIEKVEVFPEEVAQRYGYSADQRVVNFILKDDFSSREIELEYAQPWDGGYSRQEAEGTYLRIDGPARLNLNLGWTNSSMLTEAERGVDQAAAPDLASDPDPARYRSLVADSATLEATGNWTTRLGDTGNSLSVNATFEREDRLRLQGLDTVLLTDPLGNEALRSVNQGDPLRVDNRSETYALGTTLNFGVGDWKVTGTANATEVDATSRIERRLDLSALQAAARAGTLALDADLGPFADEGSDEARTRTTTAAALLTAQTNPLYLPAGDVSITLDAGFDWNRIRSEDTRRAAGETRLQRGNLTAGVNLAIPLTSRDDDFLAAAGDVSLNLSAGLDHLSDFGTLHDWSVGLTWGVTEKLTASASYLDRDSAPSLAQLGNPELATPNVAVFDFANSRTELITVISGGNPLLPAQAQSDWKLGLVWELPVLERANFSVDYIRNHSEGVSAGFPVLTPAIEAAFPGRVLRDPAGRLLQIDQRPVSFAEQEVERLQFGLNLSGRIGAEEEESRGGGGDRAGGGRGGERGGPGGPAGSAGFDPARFAAMRQLLCGENGAEVALRLARGEAVEGPDGQPVTLPPRMLERLRAGGEPDPERVEQVRARICSAERPPGGGAEPGQGARPGGGGLPPGLGRFGRLAGGPGGGGGSGRWFVNLQYALELENRVLVASGGPLLDLLDGAALAGGGQARHSASARLGLFHKGFGSFLNGAYAGASRIEGTGAPGSTDLAFGELFTLDWRMFVDLGRQQSLVAEVPFLENTRLSFDVDNLFDARQRVTDSAGRVPLRYQPFLIDPVGRNFEIELRKLF